MNESMESPNATLEIPNRTLETPDGTFETPNGTLESPMQTALETPIGKTPPEAELLQEMFNNLLLNEKVCFKSQQRDEASPTREEKLQVARTLFNRSKSQFLSRFGRFLSVEQLNYFKTFQSEEFGLAMVLRNLLRCHNSTRNQKDIKNRRYEKLKRLIQEESYFSESEMMKRNPLLYEQLIGQYLSEDERVERCVKREDTLVGILMQGIEKDLTESKKKMQIEEEQEIEDEQLIKREYTNGEHINEKGQNNEEEQNDQKSFRRRRSDMRCKTHLKTSHVPPIDTANRIKFKPPVKKTGKITMNISGSSLKLLRDNPMDVQMDIEDGCSRMNESRTCSSGGNASSMKENTFSPSLENTFSLKEDASSSNWEEKPSGSTKWGEIPPEHPKTPQTSTSKDHPVRRQQINPKVFNEKPQKSVKSTWLITAEERVLLRNEFTTLMYQSFLDGKDEDFDYDTVDYDEDLDNLDIVEHDEEERYFDEDEPEDPAMDEDCDEEPKKQITSGALKNSDDSSSEDELDIYMSALNQHPSICKLSKDIQLL